jgi:hypothetical protein
MVHVDDDLTQAPQGRPQRFGPRAREIADYLARSIEPPQPARNR